MVKKRPSKHRTSSDDPGSGRSASKSPSPTSDRDAVESPPPGAETTPEKKKSWLKRLFSGKSSKRKDSMKRSTSEPTAVQIASGDNSSTDRETSPPALATLREREDSPENQSAPRGVSHYSSSPSLMPAFRKRPVTVHVADDVWAQVQAKQEAMFRDANSLKADVGAAISSRTPPVHRPRSCAEEDGGKAEKFELTDEEWQKVKAAQNKMFCKLDETGNSDDTSKQSGNPSHEVEEAMMRVKPKEAAVPLMIVSSAKQVRTALAKKEEEEKAKKKLAAEALAKRLSSSKEEEEEKETEEEEEKEEESLEEHEFFADCVNVEESSEKKIAEEKIAEEKIAEEMSVEEEKKNVEESFEEHEFFAGTKVEEESKEEKTPKKFGELLRQQSLKVRESRESKRQKRHTIATPEFLEGEDRLWDEIQSKHVSTLGGMGSEPTRERLDDKEVEVTEDELFSDVKIRKSGVMVERKKSDSTRPSILPQKKEANESDKPRIDSGYLSADLTAVPLVQPSLGLSAGHMKRNVSRKHKRRPPSVRLASSLPSEGDTGGARQSELIEKSVVEEQEEEPVTENTAKSAEETCSRSPERSNWLQELQQKQVVKSEGIGSSATLPYKKKLDPESTAALVALAAKKKTSKESFASFNESLNKANKPKPKTMVMHEKLPATEGGPEWIRMAKKMNERRVGQGAN